MQRICSLRLRYRTDKDTAFAANFAFMRIAAAMRVVRSATMANLATGALFFVPGADFPVMTMTQLGMMLKLAGVFGKPMRAERAYEAAMVLAGALALRAGARAVARRIGRPGVVFKALVAGAGTVRHGVLPQRLLRARCRLRSSERLLPRYVFARKDPPRP